MGLVGATALTILSVGEDNLFRDRNIYISNNNHQLWQPYNGYTAMRMAKRKQPHHFSIVTAMKMALSQVKYFRS